MLDYLTGLLFFIALILVGKMVLWLFSWLGWSGEIGQWLGIGLAFFLVLGAIASASLASDRLFKLQNRRPPRKMELELLDYLLANDEPLHAAWLVFDVDAKPQNFESARHAVQSQLREGLIELWEKTVTQKRQVAEWEWRAILENPQNWQVKSGEARYFLKLTDKGARLIV